MTHGCLLVKSNEYSDEYPNGILLHTYHTGNKIPDLIKKAPLLILTNRIYINSVEAWEAVVSSDGTISDWFFYPTGLCAILIASHPMMLTHVFNNDTSKLPTWSGADDPYGLTVTHGEWMLEYPKDSGLSPEFIDPIEIVSNHLRNKP